MMTDLCLQLQIGKGKSAYIDVSDLVPTFFFCFCADLEEDHRRSFKGFHGEALQ